MTSSMSTATSSWPPRMCACDFGHCVVKISCTYALSPTRYVAWVGWCDEFRSTRFGTDHPHNDVDMGLRAGIVRID
ncbi:hypothetical protein CsSME_00045795 [Camellia sinensis var. sinensis]